VFIIVDWNAIIIDHPLSINTSKINTLFRFNTNEHNRIQINAFDIGISKKWVHFPKKNQFRVFIEKIMSEISPMIFFDKLGDQF
jgi:hypothetical protein